MKVVGGRTRRRGLHPRRIREGHIFSKACTAQLQFQRHILVDIMVQGKVVRIKKTQLEGEVSAENVDIIVEDTPELKDGEVLVKNLYLSIDPTHRIYLTGEPSYFPGTSSCCSWLNDFLPEQTCKKIPRFTDDVLQLSRLETRFPADWLAR
jgi:hypothetical protein